MLVSQVIPFPRTHNITTLLDLLPQGMVPPSEVEAAASLTDYAVLTRYPGNFEPVRELILLIDNRIDMVGVNVVPIHFYP